MTLRTKGIVKEIHHKSTSPAFKDLKVGDVLMFEVPLKRRISNGRPLASYITIINQQTGWTSELSFNQLANVIGCCEIEEVAE